jgi:hypothetical protein
MHDCFFEEVMHDLSLLYSANMSSTNDLPVARTDIRRGEKTETSSKLKLSTW